MANLKEFYTDSGSISCELLYINLFGEVPSKYSIEYSKPELRIDDAKLEFKYIADLFSDVKLVRKTLWRDLDDVDENEDTTEELDITSGGNIIIAADRRVVFIDYKNIVVYYKYNEDIEEIYKLADMIHDRLPREEVEKKESKVGVMKSCPDGYYVELCNIKKVTVNIDECYNDDFKPVYNDVVRFLSDKASGLVLFHGKAGTGKTQCIRHLINTCPGKYIIIPNGVATHLGEPDLMSFVTSNKNSIFILEDCEQLLEDREENPFNNAISNILNMADGLLSDIVNIKFICTFNASIVKIEKALLRKGRCAAKYEFKELDSEKVAVLNDKYDLKLPEVRDLTLAEIFNADKTDYAEEVKPKKIGF